MPKVFYNGSIANFRGRIGNLIFRQLPDGTTVVSAAPPKETGRRKKRAKEKRSPRQKNHNENFAEASAYAEIAQTHPVYVELVAAATILDEENQVVEVGEAIRQKGKWWKFATQTEGATIRAEAWDLPRHKTRAEFKPSCGYNLGSKEHRLPQSAP